VREWIEYQVSSNLVSGSKNIPEEFDDWQILKDESGHCCRVASEAVRVGGRDRETRWPEVRSSGRIGRDRR
jgi:hypothetical protein